MEVKRNKNGVIDWDAVRIQAASEFTKELMASSILCNKMDNWLVANRLGIEDGIPILGVMMANKLIENLKRFEG